MLLAIDIGNTNINFGLFQGSRVIKRFSLPTEDYSLQKIREKLNKGNRNIDAIIICSVVPKATKILEKNLKRLFTQQLYILGRNINAPIKNLYRKPKQVGQDRLVNAYSGVTLYGAPLIIIDFGTAITFDIISKNREYLGGMILPGLEISLEALAEKTALLPEIKLGVPRGFIGRDTKNSMLSGIIYGFAALADELVQKIKNRVGKDAKVIGTGGNINLIARFCNRIDKVDRDLTLKGLNLIYMIIENADQRH